MENYYKQYERLLSLTNLVTGSYTDSKKELDASLKRTKAFLSALGSPEKKMDFIHVAGTSGKGSVVHHLHHILQRSGEKVASYTSPHTTSYLERFHFAEALIKPEILAESIDKIISVYEDFLPKRGWLSFFELSTCLAIYAFQKAGAEYCILEAGCGGRYDATNVIPKPLVAIVTNIDKDHTEVLGNTLGQIAKEKAGIIKKHGVVFCGETRASLKSIFQEEAMKQDASLFFVSPPSQTLVMEEFGFNQQHNAALAICAAKEIGISDHAIKQASKTLKRLPCRFETIQVDPIIILDGAHSEAKMESTIKLIRSLNKPVHILYGAVASKNSAAMLKALTPFVKSISTTRFTTSFRKAAEPNALLKMVTSKKRGVAYLEPMQALEESIKQLKSKEILVVTGSLYLAGEVRTKWIPESQILKRASSY